MTRDNSPAHTRGRDVDRHRDPVIVTFSDDGEVHDVFGDTRYYADKPEHLAQLLSDLLVGWEGAVGAVAEVQMPSGQHADVRVVCEGTLRHVILFDVSDAAQERRELFQASHEMALSERRARVRLERQLTIEQTDKNGGRDNTSDLLELLSWQAQPCLGDIAGHAQLLADRVKALSTEAHSVACIQRAVMQLQALITACTGTLSAEHADTFERDSVNLERMVIELRRQFGSSPKLPDLCFEVLAPVDPDLSLDIDFASLHPIVVCLTAAMLDVTGGPVRVQFGVTSTNFVVNLRAPSEDSSHIARLWSQQLGADRRYRVSQHMVNQLGGQISPLHSGFGIQLTIEQHGQAPQEGNTPAQDVQVLLAIDDELVRTRTMNVLSSFNVTITTCTSLAEVERQAYQNEASLIVLGGQFAGTEGVALSYRLQTNGVRRRMLLLRSTSTLGEPSAWIWDGRRAVVSAAIDGAGLRLALEGVLGL